MNNDLILRFCNYLSANGKSPKTIKEYQMDLNMFYAYLKENKKMKLNKNNINGLELSDLYDFLGGLNDKGDCACTRARKVATLRSFFRYLKKFKFIDENIAVELEKPKIPKKQPIYLTKKEANKLLHQAQNSKRDYCMILLLVSCGMRVSELVGISLRDIKNDIIVITGKGDKQRTAYLNKFCIQAIDDYLEERIEPKIEEDNPLFVTKQHKRMGIRYVEKLIKKYAFKAGLNYNKLTPHKLRHTSATLMLKNNININTIAKVLGHASISTTQIYTHVDDDDERAAMAKMSVH